MSIHLSIEKNKPAAPALCKEGLGSDKAARLATAVEQVFHGHQARLGSKTLTSIAWSWAAD